MVTKRIFYKQKTRIRSQKMIFKVGKTGFSPRKMRFFRKKSRSKIALAVEDKSGGTLQADIFVITFGILFKGHTKIAAQGT